MYSNLWRPYHNIYCNLTGSNDIDVLFELAELLIQNNEVDHASEYYEKIVKIDPTNKEALQKLASYRESIGDYSGQISYLEKITEINSNDVVALKALARAYEKVKMKSKALETYKKYLEVVKDPSDYKIVKDKVEKLEAFGTSDGEASEGLIDKIMKIFGK